MTTRLLSAAFLPFLLPALLGAQASVRSSLGQPVPVASPDLATAPLRSGPITIDGRVDEGAWLDVPVLPATQHWPEFGADRTERTRYRVLHDEGYLYVSGVFHAAPHDVRGISLYRDRWNGDDAADVFIDGNADGVTGLFFITTPLGTRLDSEIRNDAADVGGVSGQNDDWNGFWDASSAIIDEGWSFEMRIPYETLGMSAGDGPPRIGLIVSRHHAATEERDIFPAIPPQWSRSHAKPSVAHRLTLPAARPGTPLFVTPYLLTGAERTRDRSAEIAAPPTTRVPFEVGGDLRLGLPRGLTLDLTANTDFAQAESDALQVNLDRFNLFFPEKRQFFQERSANFQFQMGSDIRLFHSRTIGLDTSGRPQRIWGGGRLTGSLGGWDVGALSLQVADGEGGAGENDGVLRVVKGIGEGRSYVGGIATSRVGARGGSELTFGGDALVQLADDDFLTIQAATTSSGTGGTGLADRSAVRLAWERRRLDGLTWSVEGVRSGTQFDPRLGFEGRDAFTSGVAEVFYARRPGAGSPLSRWRLMLTTRGYWATENGRLQSALQRFRGQLFFRNGTFVNVALNFTREDLDGALTLPGATVPAGSHRGVDLFTFVDLPRSGRFSSSILLFGGTAFDGYRIEARVEPRLNFSRHLTVGPDLHLQRLFFPDRNETVRADRVGLRVRAALDTRFSAETFLQYSRAQDRIAANVRLRYHRGEGRDVFLVYEGIRDLGDLVDPAARALGRTDGRLLLKVTHTVRW